MSQYDAPPRAEELHLMRQLIGGGYTTTHPATLAIARRLVESGEAHMYELDGGQRIALMRPGQEMAALEIIDENFEFGDWLRDLARLLGDNVPIAYLAERRKEVAANLVAIADRIEAMQ